MKKHKESSTLNNQDVKVDASYQSYFDESKYSTGTKLEDFAKYVKRQDLTYFISKYELFKKILNVHGSIVECGVLHGSSLMTWAKLSAMLEPVNHNRRIIGFDSFEGFTSLNENIDNTKTSLITNQNEIQYNSFDDICRAIELFDANRSLSHIPKVELVKGDLLETAESYIQKNPHLIVSLLYLDCDVYEPTKAALKAFLPRMPKGAIVVFDELNSSLWPGETLAVLEELGIQKVKINRFSFDTMISYAIIGN